jgi:predicted  nucleic acid-binding Zn ribbon protein
VLHFPEQKYCVSWKSHNTKVEKFQMTGSAMDKKITEELEKKLSALVLEWNEALKNLSAYWLFYRGAGKSLAQPTS